MSVLFSPDNIPEDPYNYLIYDRTQADADALKQLIQRATNL